MERGTIKNQNGRSVEIVLTVDKDNTIHLTRGDTARFSIGQIVNTITNTNYTPTPEDTVTMTIKKTALDEAPCVQIIVPGGPCIHTFSGMSSFPFRDAIGVMSAITLPP